MNILIAVELIVFAALLTYSNSLTAPLIFDDYAAIVDNRAIHAPGNFAQWLLPPEALPVGGRPMLNFSFLLNYAISGTQVWSYHVFNLGVHLLAGLALFGLARRTLLLPGLGERFGASSLGLALAMALLWLVHPLQTEAVTYISERAESLMGLFSLLTLYCFIRYVERRSALFAALSFICCLLGIATKEVAVTAPILVLCYDRSFVAGTFRAAWKQHRGLHLALFGTWLPLMLLLHHLSARGAGLGLGVSPWNYALTECWGIIHYLKLAVWPHPLIIDYGEAMFGRAAEVFPQAAILALLLAGAVTAFWRWPRAGFLCLSFFVILAPTSSLVPVAHEPIAEHRMYLPLACLVPLAVLGLLACGGKAYPWMVGALVLLWGLVAWERNETYLTALGLWGETVAERPANPRAHVNFGIALLAADRLPEAQAQLQEGVRLNSRLALPQGPYRAGLPHDRLGVLLGREGKTEPALAEFQQALQWDPANPGFHYDLGKFLAKIGRAPEARSQYREALRLRPDFPEAQAELAKLPAVR